MTPELQAEIVGCRGCWIFDPDRQPSVARRLDAGEEFDVWTLKNGMSLDVDGLKLPLWSDYVLCAKHASRMETGE